MINHQIKHLLTFFTLLFWMSYFFPATAQLNQSNSQSSNHIQIHFQEKEEDGSSRGRPAKRGGTGSRGECPSVNVPLTALIPAKNVGLTTSEYPTFLFFIPYQKTDASFGEFVLQDEKNNQIYRTYLNLPEIPGIVNLNLPSTMPLKVDQYYQWYFKIYCGDIKNRLYTELTSPVFVRGWVKRVALRADLEAVVKSATTPQQKAAFYAENGIWYSALSELAKLRVNEPKNDLIANNWTNLLRDIGLGNLATKPIVGEVKKIPSTAMRESKIKSQN